MKVYIVNFKRIKGALWFGFVFVFALIFTAMLLINVDAYITEQTSADAEGGKGRVIIIDPGHGGEDPGAIGPGGVYEKDLNLEIARLIHDELKTLGYDVVLTRDDDKMLYSPEENIKGMRKISDLKNRCKIAAEYDNPIFISIHMNSFGSSKYSGLQVYYADEDNESYSLAASVQASVKASLQPENNRVIKNGKDLYLLQHCNGVPIIIECGFLTNTNECEKLSQKEYQKQLSSSIVCGIIEYMEK